MVVYSSKYQESAYKYANTRVMRDLQIGIKSNGYKVIKTKAGTFLVVTK